MQIKSFAPLEAQVRKMSLVERTGFVTGSTGGVLQVSGLSHLARVGDLVRLKDDHLAEVLALSQGSLTVLPSTGCAGFALGDPVHYVGSSDISPDQSWLGRVVDPFGNPLDGRPLLPGRQSRPMVAAPPPAASRGRLGQRLETGLSIFNTFLPIVRGQRIGLFAGSGVGKSTLLSKLATGVEADVVVIALIGERGRELRDFVEDVLGADGLKRSVVVAATSDQSPMVRRRAGWAAMAVAEHFRDQGQHVLFLADSVTRFAEAHREVAAASGEAPSLRGFPPSTAQTIMSLCERAGPGPNGIGDITGVFSVLVAGSDMEEPVADILRGVLDGHVVMDRKIAERGRFPAVDVLRSVSRSLPGAASPDENALLSQARALMGVYADAEMMIQAGLYSQGADPQIDASILARPKLETFLADTNAISAAASFETLEKCLPPPQK